MVGKYKVITLCGSTRFKDAFMEAQKQLTLAGNIVISVGLFGHSGDEEVWTEGTKEMLDDMHKRKIDMADEIFVINVDGYIGASTQSEIEYARSTGKTIRYLESANECYIPDVNLNEAISRLKSRYKDLKTYCEIMSLSDSPFDPVFQRKYDAFYKVRRNHAWRDEYFRLLDTYQKKKDIMFGEILLRLFQATGRVEASFASKMLATLNPDMPIWDANVLYALKLKLDGNTPELKLSNAVVVYDRICRWYHSFLQTNQAKEWIDRFNQAFPEFDSFSDTKKVDFILWANPSMR